MRVRLGALAAALLTACAAYLLWELRAPAGFILGIRAERLWSLVLVGAAIGAGTVTFQTVTGNRILTPSIMGFDALFVLVQTTGVFVLGAAGYAATIGPAKFLADTGVMMAASVALFALLLGRGRHDLHRMILVGVVMGLFFRSLTGLMQRLIDPSEFGVVQGAMFASFAPPAPGLLPLATLFMLPVLGLLIWLAPRLDVVALGRGPAVGLGLNYDRMVLLLLALVAVLVSVSTALVGPVTFLGLLVASLAHALVPGHRHACLLPAAMGIAALILVAGQTVFERLLHLQSTLAVIVEFTGGLLFLVLVLRGGAR